ncbi:MAG: hypothetical protein WC647_13670 [Desulfomonilaceae bacterium]|jgi:hypothetical protein
MKVIAAAIIFTLLPVVSLSADRSTTVRNPDGNLVETKDSYGNDTTGSDRGVISPEPNIMKVIKRISATGSGT